MREHQQTALDRIFAEAYRRANGGQVRVVRLEVPGREIELAHIIGMPDPSAYHNLGLNIGFHAGAAPEGDSIGLVEVTPAECAVIAADIAVKFGDVDLGFMDRFSGHLIITGALAEVRSAIDEVVRYFHDDMGYHVCPITEQ